MQKVNAEENNTVKKSIWSLIQKKEKLMLYSIGPVHSMFDFYVLYRIIEKYKSDAFLCDPSIVYNMA